MNLRIKKFLRGNGMTFRLSRLLAFGLLAVGCASWLIAQHTLPDLTVHEWGTFTAVAGKNGDAVVWAPWAGSIDLPGFVEHLNSLSFKIGLRGTTRMETPVLYFYSPRDEKVSVGVAFSKGVITEWYPHADRVRPSGVLRDTQLSHLQADGSIQWSGVAVSRI